MTNANEMQAVVHSVWPDWTLEEELGQGSFGVVYRARRQDIAGESFCAVKICRVPRSHSELQALRAEMMSEENTCSYLEHVVRDYSHEIRLMEEVKGHSGIVYIEDYKVVRLPEKTAWYILIRMEILTPLARYIAVHPMEETDIIRLGEDLLGALCACASHHIIHRDIKPENIFISDAGSFKLGDFGVARRLDSTTLDFTRAGALNFMAPELYLQTSESVSFSEAARGDQYALGLVMYYLANGLRLPFLPAGKQILSPDERKKAFQRRISGEALPAPSGNISEGLKDVILKACAYRQEDRYESPEAMLRALKSVKSDGIITDPIPRGWRKWLILAAAVLLAGLVWAAASFFLSRQRPSVLDDPQSITAKAGEEVSFTVRAEGSVLSYQWQAQTADGEWISAEDWGQSNSDTLRFTFTDPGLQAAAFRCAITDRYGETVYSAPAVLSQAIQPNEGVFGSGMAWHFDDQGILTISGQGKMDPFSPDEIPWLGFRDQIETVMLEDGITEIGDYAFSGCPRLRQVSLPGGLSKIGDFAFAHCGTLQELRLPEGTYALGTGICFECVQLKAVYIPVSVVWVGEYAFRGCNIMTFFGPAGSYAQIEARAYKREYKEASSALNLVTPSPRTPIVVTAKTSDSGPVYIGSTVVFEVEADAYQPEYLWQCRASSDTDWADADLWPDYRTSKLTMEDISLRYNHYLFRCKVTDHDGYFACTDPFELTLTESITMTTLYGSAKLIPAEASAPGYAGDVRVHAFFGLDGRVSYVSVVREGFSETPGVGDRALDNGELSAFCDRYVPLNAEDIDALAGATVTKQAIVEAVNTAYGKVFSSAQEAD